MIDQCNAFAVLRKGRTLGAVLRVYFNDADRRFAYQIIKTSNEQVIDESVGFDTFFCATQHGVDAMGDMVDRMTASQTQWNTVTTATLIADVRRFLTECGDGSFGGGVPLGETT